MTPMRTVTSGEPGLANAVYHPGPPSVVPAAFQSQVPGLGGSAAPVPVPLPQLKQLDFNNLQAYPCALSCGGIGAKVYQEKDGVTVSISIVFHLNDPHIVFGASVSGSGVNAHVELLAERDKRSLRWRRGRRLPARSRPIWRKSFNPAEINVPLGGLVVPLTAKLSQALDITTGFSAKTSVLHGEGSLDFDGDISVSYQTGRGWDVARPTATVKNNLAGLISGVSMGINSFVFAFQSTSDGRRRRTGICSRTVRGSAYHADCAEAEPQRPPRLQASHF